jgi:hypothetical protein
VLAQEIDRRLLRLAQEVEGARQQHGDRAALREGLDAGLVGVFKMIGRQGAEARGQRCAAQGRELFGMQLNRQAERARGLEDARRLLGREGDRFAEGVDRVGESRLRHRRQLLFADLCDVSVLVAVGLGRQRVRPEEGRDDRQRQHFAQTTGDAQDFISLSRSRP